MDFYNVHTHKEFISKNVFSILNTYPNSKNFSEPFSIGIHPWFIKKETISEELKLVEEKLEHQNCFAVGECGLDKLLETNFEFQKEVFNSHILLSEKYQKPLIIHCVKSYQEIIQFKKELKPKQIWILHGFHKNIQMAQSLLKNRIIVSVGAAIIKNKKLQEVIFELPFSAFLLETDASELAIQEIYKKVASIKKIEVVELQQKMKQNFINIFNR